MITDAIDMSAHRERKAAAERERRTHRDLEAVRSKNDLLALVARCQDLAASTVDERAAERERRDSRRERLRDAGVPTPRPGTPQSEAWDRVVRARSVDAVAAPGHAGSREAIRAVIGWQKPGDPRSILVLAGAPGTGKTVATWLALANEGGVYLPAGDVAPTQRWDDARARAKRAGLLVVNDAHERMTAWAWGALSELVESRHDVGKRTLLTANLSASALIAAMGPRVASRLGGAQGAVVTIAGPDMRAADWRRS